MIQEKYEIIESLGWTVECESPLEIRHKDGSFATLNAAKMVVTDLLKNYKKEKAQNHKGALTRLAGINDYIQVVVNNAISFNMKKKEDWNTVYGLVFNPNVSAAALEALESIHVEFKHDSTNLTQKDDIIAFSRALNYKVSYLQKIAKKQPRKTTD